MSDFSEIRLPTITLRDYQYEDWTRLWSNDCKRAFLLWHRRAGKDLFSLQFMVAKAMARVGNYWYILPQQNQVRRALWEGITSQGVRYLDTIPKELIYSVNKSEMKIVLINQADPSLPGSILSFLGGDNYDALAGGGPVGVILSEYPLQKPSLFELIIEPMLRENNGWCVFNGTPRGENHAKDMYDFLESKPEKYYVSKRTIEDTGVVKLEDIEEERERGKAEELIQQEYYCSFAGAIHGAYYADVLNRYVKTNYGLFPYMAEHPVYTVWDIGANDTMVIWFIQIIQGSIRVIDYYENHTLGFAHYAQVVLDKPYMYAKHLLPHDGDHQRLTPTERTMTAQNQLLRLGLTRVEIVPRTKNVVNDIQAVRAILPRCFFHELTTKNGYMAMKQYRREYDENRKIFKDTPYHDWASNPADAFRIVPILEQEVTNARTTKNKAKEWNGSFR